MSSQSCAKKFCKKQALDEAKRLKKFRKVKTMRKSTQRIFDMRKSTQRLFDKYRIKKSQDDCEMYYCNPTCKGTIFESGKNIPNAIKNEYKNLPSILNMERKTRKNIFGEKTNVLKNGFYEKLKKKNVNKLKKNGALSKCFLEGY